jgi:glucokinase
MSTLELLQDRDGTGPGGDGGPVVGVDIGGTKTAILVCDADGTPRARRVAPTAIGAPERVADAIASLVEAAVIESGSTLGEVAIVGVGVPGRVDVDRGEVTLAVNLDWHDLPLGPRLEARLGVPVVLENDVRAAALGLHRRQVFGETRSLGLLAIGTGISAGVVIAGELHRGAHGLAGEIGHAIVDPDGPRCACGMHGCFEVVAAGPAIAARAAAAWGAAAVPNAAAVRGAPDPRPGSTSAAPAAPATSAAPGSVGAEVVFEAAAAGDAIAAEVIESAGRAVGWGIHLLALAYDLELIVIGGGVSHAGEPFMAPVRREIERLRDASPLARELLAAGVVQLLPPGADAGAWGAVTIARDALARRPRAVAPGREVDHA